MQMSKARSLDELLRCHEVSADEFFQAPGIAQQIRSKLPRFVRYCRSHRPFARRMLTLALNIPADDLDLQPALRTASHAVTEVLSNEEPAVAELFFEEEAKAAGEGSDIPEELEGGIQSEAERLLGFDDDEPEQAQQQRAVEVGRLELAELSLEILRDPERNATCLGHLHKLYSFLIRHNPLPVLHYFQEAPDALALLLNNLRYSSVSSLVAQLLTSEDKSRAYEHEGLKRRIIEFVIEEMFRRVEDEDFFDGVMILIEEILNTTKQSYYEYFEDFKRVSNLLVSATVMRRFLDLLLALQEKPFRSASRFLELLFTRINSEREDNSYYHRGEETEPSMNFEADIFYEYIPALMALVPKIEGFNSLTKISYIAFLQALLISGKAKGHCFALSDSAFIGLLDCLNRQEKAGIFKGKLYNLINGIISRTTPEETTQFLQAHEDVWDDYFSSIRAANYANTKIYNKNESSAFDVSIISQLAKKNEAVLPTATKAIGKDLKRICKKYETKIASFQSSSSFVLEDESNFESFSFETNSRADSTTTNGTTPAFSLNLVGKNSISIPVLQLPDRYQEERERGNEREAAHINGIKEIIEVEEVVVLTETIKTLTLNDREDCHIERPPELSRNEQELYSPEKPPIKQAKSKQSEEPKPQPQEPTPSIKAKEAIHHEQARFFAKHLLIFA